MKYIVFWEFCPKDYDKVVERFLAYDKQIETQPDEHPKIIFNSHSMSGKTKGFKIVESTPEQMINEINHWMGYVTHKFVPILDAEKIAESYMKSK